LFARPVGMYFLKAVAAGVSVLLLGRPLKAQLIIASRNKRKERKQNHDDLREVCLGRRPRVAVLIQCGRIGQPGCMA